VLLSTTGYLLNSSTADQLISSAPPLRVAETSGLIKGAALKEEHSVFISVGSNLGNRRDNCCRGIAALADTDGCRLVSRAPCYRTEPVGFTDQDLFVNTVVRIDCRLAPGALLSRLKEIETAAGRKPSVVRFGPRVLDMDILLFGDRVIDEPGISIPHPRMHERRFVLIPFCDIDPEIFHPVLGEKMTALLHRLDGSGQKVDPYPCDC
jgi:2-amino-4-hydroxy-6-hydroxymethyldihydropteridine diphosphokinase